MPDHRGMEVADVGRHPIDRLARDRTVTTWLGGLDETELCGLLTDATALGTGIGGTTASIDVAGGPVFVKRVPLTDLELRVEHHGCTRNLFELPTFYQYGVGSAGFGAWRELAAHRTVSDWVRQGRSAGFPLLHHWRILPVRPEPMEPAAIDTWVSRWGGHPAIRRRLTAISAAPASLVLFMEHVGHRLDRWLAARSATGGSSAAAAYAMVDRSLESTTRLLAEHDFVHFDAHTHNLLTDGHEIYLADFGLAAHADFDLDPAEYAFLRRHRHYDRCYTATHLVFAAIGNALREPWPACLDYLRSRPGDDHPRLPREAVALVRRYSAIATIMGGFWQAVIRDRTAPYPADALADALAAASASPG